LVDQATEERSSQYFANADFFCSEFNDKAGKPNSPRLATIIARMAKRLKNVAQTAVTLILPVEVFVEKKVFKSVAYKNAA
jgi:hypothetical protein